MLKKILKICALLAIMLFVYGICLYAIQDDLIFYPDKTYVGPNMAGVGQFEEQPLVTADGHLIMAWYAKGQKNKPVILFFHGNAGQLARFAPLLKIYHDAGYGIFMPEYRGFAHSGGQLTEDTMYADAITSFDFVKNRLTPEKIVVLGYSMGTAPASFLAQVRQPDALILLAPFLSLEKEVADKPVPLATLVLKNKLESEKYLAKYKNPLLIMHGKLDKLILPYHGQKMFAISPSKDKTLKLVDGVDHHQLFFDVTNHQQVLNWLQNRF